MSTMTVGTTGPGKAPVDSHAGAAFFCREVRKTWDADQSLRVLIAGCGSGHEAAAIQLELDAEVFAVDVEPFVPESLMGKERLHFQLASVTDLPFEDDSFDVVFYHHVIEHVDDPSTSLREIQRMMQQDGLLFVGTPNRNRLISSVGAHEQSEWEASLRNKLKDNVQDLWARCRGRFRNEFGAHAGFTKRELETMLSPLFSRRRWVTEEYLGFKYDQHRLSTLVRWAAQPPWIEVLAPSIYVFCRI